MPAAVLARCEFPPAHENGLAAETGFVGAWLVHANFAPVAE